ncbi:MAG: hypothetical protein JXX29_22025 [Deltaproteobacteria bacterium]|nr:hypothetical protein [Deltaproteobacteria bacterium]MBN2674374.1 hypothetical protein [Deltaproteobacteria bacterium]
MRAKIIIPNLVIVLCLGTAIYLYLDTRLRNASQEALQKQLRTVSTLFVRSEALRSYEQLQDVSRLSMSKAVSDVFSVLDIERLENEADDAHERRIRDAWFKKALTAVETSAASLSGKGREPALVFITDRNGVVLARNTTPNACPAGKNVSNAMPVVKRALDGEAQYRIWSAADSPLGSSEHQSGHLCTLINPGLLELSAAPIWSADDKVAGTIVVGYEVSNGMAAEKAKDLGVELAVVHGNDVYSTSIETDAARQELNRELRSAGGAQLKNVFAGAKSTTFFSITLRDTEYTAISASVPNASQQQKVAFVFLGEQGRCAFAKNMRIAVWGLIGFAVVCVFVVGVFLGNYFIRPVVEIEEGLLKIINGDYDYRFDVESDEVGGLSYRINQLVNVLKEEDDSDESTADDS